MPGVLLELIPVVLPPAFSKGMFQLCFLLFGCGFGGKVTDCNSVVDDRMSPLPWSVTFLPSVCIHPFSNDLGNT